MPPRSTPPQASVYPSSDSATYRDLLYFEERLKSNAARLQRRKARYQLFLFQLLLIIAFLLAEVLLPPQISILAIPCKFVLGRVLPDIYTPDVEVNVHPYFSTGLLFVSVTTLVLFFASGMYSEKIGYANKYVPHANRALRSFNMYFNVRKPPLRSKFYFNPLAFFFPRPDEHTASTSRTTSPSPTRTPRSRASSTLPIPSIPPASSPRGELIFSSRVDKTFQESYQRYRAQFERRRQEKEREANKKWWQQKLLFWRKPPPTTSTGTGSGSPPAGPSMAPPATRTASTSSSSSSRGRGSRSGTPPVAQSGIWGGGMRPQRDRSVSPMHLRRGISPPTPSSRDGGRPDQGGEEHSGTLPLALHPGRQPAVIPHRVYLEERSAAEMRE